jgi:site-specific DNA recombinase
MEELWQRVSALRPVGKQRVTSRPAPRENWILICYVPPIVTPEAFAQVQKKLQQNQKFSSCNNTAWQYLLRALVSCGHCQLAASARGGKSSYAYYVCNGRNKAVHSRRDRSCQAPFIPAAALDELVWNNPVEVLKHPPQLFRRWNERAVELGYHSTCKPAALNSPAAKQTFKTNRSAGQLPI